MTAKKLASLDALRGVAILLVIAAHFGSWTETSIFLGNAGVILFFFLSGFLMDRTLTEQPKLSAYLTRRALRILPMYWFSLLLVVAFGRSATATDLLANATFTAPIFGTDRMLGVYWTLYIEVLFYLVAPVLKRAGDFSVALSICGVIAALAVIAAVHGIGKGAPLYILFCLCGMQISAWHRGTISGRIAASSSVAASVVAGILLPISPLIMLVPAACATALVFCLIHNPQSRLLSFVGTVSYSWYLLHSIFGYKFLSWPIPHWFAIAAGIACTFAASTLTYFIVERPFIRLGKSVLQ